MLPSSVSELRDYLTTKTSFIQNEYPFWTTLVILSGVWSLFRCGMTFLNFAGSFVYAGGNVCPRFIHELLVWLKIVRLRNISLQALGQVYVFIAQSIENLY